MGERIVARARAYEMTDEQVESMGRVNLTAIQVKYRVHKWGLARLHRLSHPSHYKGNNRPGRSSQRANSRDNFCHKSIKEQAYYSQRGKNPSKKTPRQSSIPPQTSVSAPDHSSHRVGNRLVSPLKAKSGSQEGRWWWGRLTHISQHPNPYTHLHLRFGMDFERFFATVYGLARKGDRVRVKLRGQGQDFEDRSSDPLYDALPERTGPDDHQCETGSEPLGSS